MNSDTPLLERLGAALTGRSDVVEERMVGGRSFIVGGHLCLGVSGDSLMVRVGPEAYERSLAERDVRPLKLGEKHPVGCVLVDPPAIRSESDLARWIERGLDFVATLPTPKASAR